MADQQYTSTANAKLRIGLEVADTSQDVAISALIDTVSRLFDRYVGEPLSQASQVEYHDGSGFQNSITLNHMPSEDATDRAAFTVTEDGVELVQDTDYMLDPYPARVLYRMASAEGTAVAWPSGVRNIKVEYLSRFKVPPDDLDRAAADEAARAFQNFNTQNVDGNRIGVAQRSPESGTTLSFEPDDLSPTTKRTLDAYRKELSF